MKSMSEQKEQFAALSDDAYLQALSRESARARWYEEYHQEFDHLQTLSRQQGNDAALAIATDRIVRLRLHGEELAVENCKLTKMIDALAKARTEAAESRGHEERTGT